MSGTPEFSRTVRVDTLGNLPRRMDLEASPEERQALARRFNIQSIEALSADAQLTAKGEEISAAGELRAAVTQACVITGEPVPAEITEPFDIVFRPHPAGGGSVDEEVELSESELDVVFYDGALADVGEAVAETLALALDPYPRSPNAAQAIKDAGIKSEDEVGPFSALADLKAKLKK